MEIKFLLLYILCLVNNDFTNHANLNYICFFYFHSQSKRLNSAPLRTGAWISNTRFAEFADVRVVTWERRPESWVAETCLGDESRPLRRCIIIPTPRSFGIVHLASCEAVVGDPSLVETPSLFACSSRGLVCGPQSATALWSTCSIPSLSLNLSLLLHNIVCISWINSSLLYADCIVVNKKKVKDNVHNDLFNFECTTYKI